MKVLHFFIFPLMLLLLGHIAQAEDYAMPASPEDGLIGTLLSDSDETPEKYFTIAGSGEDTLLDIARRYNVGQTEILLSNPGVDRWLPKHGAQINIPNRRLLPDAPRKGIVINLPEYRMYYYESDVQVTTHPISIGRIDWYTPLGKTKIVVKTENPTWTPPESIRKEHAQDGDILPAVVPAGPDNPLGLYAMRLGVPGYLIHSTNKPFGVGMSVTHGCIRMYPEDIEQLFPRVEVGTEVHIVNQPIKVGWHGDTLFLEVHPPLEGTEMSYEEALEQSVELIINANNNNIPRINIAALKQALTARDGAPVEIYKKRLE